MATTQKKKQYRAGRPCVVRVVTSEVESIGVGALLIVHPKHVTKRHDGSLSFLRDGERVMRDVSFTFMRHATNEEWRDILTSPSWKCYEPMTDEEMGDDSFERKSKALDPALAAETKVAPNAVE